MDTNNNDSTINFIQANDCIIIRVPGRGITMVQRWNKTAFNQLNELIVKKDVEKLTELLDQLKKNFAKVRHAKPASSRADSSESFIVAMGFRGADKVKCSGG